MGPTKHRFKCHCRRAGGTKPLTPMRSTKCLAKPAGERPPAPGFVFYVLQRAGIVNGRGRAGRNRKRRRVANAITGGGDQETSDERRVTRDAIKGRACPWGAGMAKAGRPGRSRLAGRPRPPAWIMRGGNDKNRAPSRTKNPRRSRRGFFALGHRVRVFARSRVTLSCQSSRRRGAGTPPGP